MPPLAANGKPLRISVSAADTFEDCPRKWFYSYYLRLDRPPSQSLIVGNAVHDKAEKYLKGELSPEDCDDRWWRTLEPGLEFLPDDHSLGQGMPGWTVENWLKGMCGPLAFSGKVDFWKYQDGQLTVSDWKTTGDPSWRWAKTPSKLAALRQPLVYSSYLAQDYLAGQDITRLEFQHIYLSTKGEPKAMDVWAHDVSWSAVTDARGALEEMASEMAFLAEGSPEAEDITPNMKACRKFGGCEWADRCPASPQNRNQHIPFQSLGLFSQTTTETTESMSKLDDIYAKLGLPTDNNKTPEPIAAPEVLSPSAPSATDVVAALRPLLETTGHIPSDFLEAQAHAAGVMPYEVMTALGVRKDGLNYVPKVVLDIGVNKPFDEHTRDAFAGETITRKAMTEEEVVAGLAERFSSVDSDEAKAYIKKALSIKRLSKSRLSRIGEALAALKGEPEPVVEPEPSPTEDCCPDPSPECCDEEIVLPELALVEVFVDAVPDGGGAVPIEYVMAPIFAQVEKHFGVPHWSIPKYNEGGNDALGLFSQQLFDGSLELPPMVLVDSRHPLASRIVEVLNRREDTRVIRGIR